MLNQRLLIIKKHAAQLKDLAPEDLQKLIHSISLSVKSLYDLGAEGVIVLCNEGHRCTGASIPEHLHLHLIPRCSGDTSNFAWRAMQKLIEATQKNNENRIEPFKLYRQLLQKVGSNCYPKEKSNDCILCTIAQAKDDAQFSILRRFSRCVAFLNRFGYGNGHVIICPLEHTERLSDLNQQTQEQLMRAISDTRQVMEEELTPHGFNYAIKNGPSNIANHVHAEVIGRWDTDCSSLNVCAQRMVITKDQAQLYEKLVNKFKSIEE